MPSRAALIAGAFNYALLVFLGTAGLGFVVLPALGHAVGLFPIDADAQAAFSLVTLKAVPILLASAELQRCRTSGSWLSRSGAVWPSTLSPPC